MHRQPLKKLSAFAMPMLCISLFSHCELEDVQDVRQGKYIEVTIDEENTDIAKQKLDQMCEKLLANLVIEDYSVEIE